MSTTKLTRASAREMLEEAGLGHLMSQGGSLVQSQLDEIEDVTEKALVVQYSRIVQRIAAESGDLTPKALNDLTMALHRIRGILDKQRSVTKEVHATRSQKADEFARSKAEGERISALSERFAEAKKSNG